ncbi:MAG: DUF4058 family protein [Cyanobacteria bacterium J06621_11]
MVIVLDALSEQLSDTYRVAIEKCTYLSQADESVLVGIPDVSVVTQKAQPTTDAAPTTAVLPRTVTVPMAEEVEERYLEIRDVNSGAVVTAIELLSPKNKRSSEGRRAYEKKRYKVLASLTNLVEIDLLRSGKPLPAKGTAGQGCYSILVSRSDLRPRAELYDFGIKQSIPSFVLPLKPEESLLSVDLQQLLAGVYKRAKYHLAIDYRKPLKPKLSEADQAWIDDLLRT